ncbi:MAG: nucleotidyltransferase family protein [Candidatus Omnitrophica bacterium]|nr:nucleotidyltransferase family protein [Candidatus Omnitrophota bacterium]
MKALILAAGYATRLYPLTKEYPKPLLEVGHKPIINYILDKLEPLGEIDEILVVTNSKFMPKFNKWRSKLHSKKPITLIDDLTKSNNDRRGAIGDTAFVINKKRLKDDLLVMGGDNLFNADLKVFLSFVKDNPNPTIGAYNIKNIRKASNYGVIKLNKKNVVVDFKEKPKNPESTLIAMCLYYFPKGKLKLIKEYLCSSKETCDATGFYIDWLRKRVPVYGFVFNGFWYDIGNHKFYREAKQRFQ